MSQVLLSRQPILQADLNPYGYELLFRDSEVESANIHDADEATAQVLVNTFMEIGLDEMVGPHKAFINVSRHFLMSDFCEALPPDRVVLELQNPDDVAAGLTGRIDELRSLGYRIAVGDFVFKPEFEPLLARADIVKLDFLHAKEEELRPKLDILAKYRPKTAGERVETQAAFQMGKSLGLDYFQGYFFCKPQPVQSKRLPLSRMVTLGLIATLNSPDIKISELEAAIRRDPSLSYRLMKYVGSAGFATQKPIESIRHAAVLVGIERLKTWAALILFSGIEESAKELTVTGLTRARMCEKLAEAMKLPHPDQLFLVGLFSVLDAMLGQPLPTLVESLRLSPEITGALLSRQGVFGEALRCVETYERRDWPNVRCGGLDAAAIRDAYLKAVSWSIQTMTGFSAMVAEDAVRKENRKHFRRESSPAGQKA